VNKQDGSISNLITKQINDMIAILSATNDGTTADRSSYFSDFFKDPNPRRAGFRRLAFEVVIGCIFLLSLVIGGIFDHKSIFFSAAMSTWGMGHGVGYSR
jgi:hypothetical protein